MLPNLEKQSQKRICCFVLPNLQVVYNEISRGSKKCNVGHWRTRFVYFFKFCISIILSVFPFSPIRTKKLLGDIRVNRRCAPKCSKKTFMTVLRHNYESFCFVEICGLAHLRNLRICNSGKSPRI
jgi:hypothetical protein